MSSLVNNPFSTCDLVFVVTTVFSVGHCFVVHGLEGFVLGVDYGRIGKNYFLVIGSEFF